MTPDRGDTGVGILASAYVLPPAVRTAEEIFRAERIPQQPLAAAVDFRRDIGIRHVHVAEDASPSALGLDAAREALRRSGLDPGDLDLIVDYTSIPEDYVAPTWAAAGLVQRELGAHRALAVAINTGGCASYHIALQYACAQMAAKPRMRHALLFSGNKAPASNRVYYPITITCDSGGALVLKRGHDRRRILTLNVATLGELHDVWYVAGLGGRRFLESRGVSARGDEWLHMRSDMERFNEGVIKINLFMFRKVMRAAMKPLGAALGDIRCFVYPSFSVWDQRSFCSGLQIPPEAVYMGGLEMRGHLQENDMVANYDDAAAAGRIAEGDLVMVTTNGAGFNWGAAVVRH
jgi:3-oxoacyl-[acyl-carrier-protein] synthase-3